MATRTEIERIAAAMNALRPNWPARSLVTFLETHHASRPYQDLAVAAVFVACDPRTTTPELLNQPAPWRVAGRTTGATGGPPGPRVPRCPIHPHEAERCSACRSEWLAGDGWPHGTHHPDAPKETP